MITRSDLEAELSRLLEEAARLYQIKQTSYNAYLIDKGKHDQVTARADAIRQALNILKRENIED